MGHKLNLSGRLRAVASFALPGLPLADIGTDHGYVPIYLAEAGIIPRAIAADVRTGPLERAEEHIREYGLEDKIEVRLSDGLTNIAPGEVTQVLIAGMGGSLMARILAEGRDVLQQPGFRRLILSPQSEVWLVRKELARSGFQITEEHMVKDEGKFYFIIIGEPGVCDYSTEEDFLFGRRLTESGDEVFLEYLEEKRKKDEEILTALKKRAGMKKKTKPETEVEKEPETDVKTDTETGEKTERGTEAMTGEKPERETEAMTGEKPEPETDVRTGGGNAKIQERIAEIEEEKSRIFQVESRMKAEVMPYL